MVYPSFVNRGCPEPDVRRVYKATGSFTDTDATVTAELPFSAADPTVGSGLFAGTSIADNVAPSVGPATSVRQRQPAEAWLVNGLLPKR